MSGSAEVDTLLKEGLRQRSEEFRQAEAEGDAAAVEAAVKREAEAVFEEGWPDLAALFERALLGYTQLARDRCLHPRLAAEYQRQIGAPVTVPVPVGRDTTLLRNAALPFRRGRSRFHDNEGARGRGYPAVDPAAQLRYNLAMHQEFYAALQTEVRCSVQDEVDTLEAAEQQQVSRRVKAAEAAGVAIPPTLQTECPNIRLSDYKRRVDVMRAAVRVRRVLTRRHLQRPTARYVDVDADGPPRTLLPPHPSSRGTLLLRELYFKHLLSDPLLDYPYLHPAPPHNVTNLRELLSSPVPVDVSLAEDSIDALKWAVKHSPAHRFRQLLPDVVKAQKTFDKLDSDSQKPSEEGGSPSSSFAPAAQ